MFFYLAAPFTHSSIFQKIIHPYIFHRPHHLILPNPNWLPACQCVDIEFAEPADVAEVNDQNCFNSTDIKFNLVFSTAALSAASSYRFSSSAIIPSTALAGVLYLLLTLGGSLFWSFGSRKKNCLGLLEESLSYMGGGKVMVVVVVVEWREEASGQIEWAGEPKVVGLDSHHSSKESQRRRRRRKSPMEREREALLDIFSLYKAIKPGK
jgi:hypothetical protein